MVRVIKNGILCVFVAGLLVASVGVASAYANSPWWHLTSSARPSNLQPGRAKDEVQKLTVSATGGEFVLVRKEAEHEAAAVVKFDATPEELQGALESMYGEHNVDVGGGQGNETGSEPYEIKFTGELADQPIEPIEAISEFFTIMLDCDAATGPGCTHEATLAETSKGEFDGYVVVRTADLGDENVEAASPVTIADKLPQGVRAVHIEAAVGEAAFLQEVGSAECTLASLSCRFTGFLPDYDSIEVVIAVALEQDAKTEGINEALVSGGGAPEASVRRPLTISSAPTQFGVESYEMDAEEVGGGLDTQAGSHPFQLTTTLAQNETEAGEPVAQVKDLNFKLPPGLIGNPTPFQQCALARFYSPQGPQCSIQTVVGVARVTIYDSGFGPTSIASPLYNLEPSAGEPARFGFFAAVVPVVLDTSVRTGGDYGVTVTARNITQIEAFVANEVTFWGVPGDERHEAVRGQGCLNHVHNRNSPAECGPLDEHSPPPLLTLPTSCTGPLQSTVEADSWIQEGDFQTFGTTEPMQALDGCNRLQFNPSISVAPDGQAASTPTGLTVAVHVPQDVSLDAEGLAEADVKNTTVTLPEGVALNPAAADGLLSCSVEQAALENDAEPTCPEASKVGTVKIQTPLLPNALEGAAYLAAQNANPFGSLLALYVVAQDPVSGTLVKIAGEVKPDPVTGQLVSTFKNTPQLPFEEFQIKFFGGDRAPLSTPALCGQYTTTASIVPWSVSQPVESSSTFDVVSGPNGSACQSPLPFAPSLATGSPNINAGSFTPLTTTITREDGQQNIQSVQLHYPPGLSGALAGVKLCPEAQANAGTCGQESRIGSTTVSVGLGGDPYSVTGGEVFLTEKIAGSPADAPFGLSIVNPAVAGPFNLGKVIVRATIEVDPHTAALTITTNSSGPYAIPHILDGIPLQIKHVNVTIDRPGFTFNPTDCEKMAITGTIGSTEGASASVSTPFQVTNCAALKFAPKFTASTSGATSKANGASLSVKLTYPQGGEANLHSVHVQLPRFLPARLTTLQQACTEAQFNANPAGCPSASVVGYAKAVTSILPVPLQGPAYFVSHGGAKFPELILVLQGDGVTIDLAGETFISSTTKGTSSTFASIPDAPVSSFELNLPRGKFSALAANGNLCAQSLEMPTKFVAQDGATLSQNTHVEVTGCSKTFSVVSKKLRGRTLTLQISVPAAGKLKVSGKGLGSGSKSSSGRGTVTIRLHVKKHGKTAVKISFKPSKGKRQSKTLRVKV